MMNPSTTTPGAVNTSILPMGSAPMSNTTAPVQSSNQSLSSDKDADQIVLSYLKKKGYKNTEGVFKNEQRALQKVEDFQTTLDMENEVEASALSNIILFHNKNENAQSYKDSYSALREWILSALDIYRTELMSLLYPVFVHCYLDLVQKGFADEARGFLEHFKTDHEDSQHDELVRLQSVTLPEHMQENDLVKSLRSTSSSQSRFTLRLCRFSFDLLLSYLHEKKYMLLLSILNQYINIKVFNGQPSQSIDNAIMNLSNANNRREFYFGLFDEQIPKDKNPPPAVTADPKDSEPNAKKTKIEGPTPLLGAPTPAAPVPNKPRSQVAIPRMSDQMEAEYFEDLRKRVSLSSLSLPSICFFTFFHSQQNLCTVDISAESNLVGGGFGDSSIKIWDLKKNNMYKAASATTSDFVAKNTSRRTDYMLMTGHSGPVYGLSFSPDARFLLSSSEDKTARLWNTETGANIVVYRGHNYPVWDTQFSSLGYLFATASHDRTARLWSTDRIYPLRIFAGHLSDVICVRFHPNCNYVATGSTDKTVRLWDIQSGQTVRLFTGGHNSSVNCVSVSPDGKYLASSGDDNKIVLWDLGSSKKITTFSGHTDTIWSLDFSAESTLLASGSADNSVKIWDVSSASGNKRKLSGTAEEAISTPTTVASNAENNPTNAVENTTENATKPETSSDLLKSFPTKNSSVFKVKFTKRNLLLASGPFGGTGEESQ